MKLIEKIKQKILSCYIYSFKKLFMHLKNNIHYINGPEVLPPPLTKNQESEIMAKITAGDNSKRELLITHNLRLVVYIAKKFDTLGACVEDLISIGTIGLIKAVNTFCPERNIKLATYASRCIENEILMYLRKSSQLKNETSIDEPLNTDWDGNELLLSDILGSDGEPVGGKLEQEVECKMLSQAINKLSSRDKAIMEFRFGLSGKKEHTQKEVANLMGISQSYISRLEKRIINKLKRDLEKVS